MTLVEMNRCQLLDRIKKLGFRSEIDFFQRKAIRNRDVGCGNPNGRRIKEVERGFNDPGYNLGTEAACSACFVTQDLPIGSTD